MAARITPQVKAVRPPCPKCGTPVKRAGAIHCSRECAGNTKHLVSLTQEYAVWKHMRNRCNNPNCRDYPRYGGRGLTIDPRWDAYENFREDMGPRPSNMHSIERIDNNKGYGPHNCKWGTKAEQSQNRSGNWTPEEDARLCEVMATGCNYRQAAKLIGKTYGQVAGHAKRLGLKTTYDPHAPRRAPHPSTVSKPGKVCGYHDGCPPDGPVCHLCEHLQP